MFQKAFNRDLTLPSHSTRRELPESSGILKKGLICVELRSFYCRKKILVPMSYISWLDIGVLWKAVYIFFCALPGQNKNIFALCNDNIKNKMRMLNSIFSSLTSSIKNVWILSIKKMPCNVFEDFSPNGLQIRIQRKELHILTLVKIDFDDFGVFSHFLHPLGK